MNRRNNQFSNEKILICPNSGDFMVDFSSKIFKWFQYKYKLLIIKNNREVIMMFMGVIYRIKTV